MRDTRMPDEVHIDLWRDKGIDHMQDLTATIS
jgi:hypothetical protein